MLLHQEMDISIIPLVRRELLLFLVLLELLKFLLYLVVDLEECLQILLVVEAAQDLYIIKPEFPLVPEVMMLLLVQEEVL
jgi:hypothetical protein